jgi:hypothetical protein
MIISMQKFILLTSSTSVTAGTLVSITLILIINVQQGISQRKMVHFDSVPENQKRDSG